MQKKTERKDGMPETGRDAWAEAVEHDARAGADAGDEMPEMERVALDDALAYAGSGFTCDLDSIAHRMRRIARSDITDYYRRSRLEEPLETLADNLRLISMEPSDLMFGETAQLIDVRYRVDPHDAKTIDAMLTFLDPICETAEALDSGGAPERREKQWPAKGLIDDDLSLWHRGITLDDAMRGRYFDAQVKPYGKSNRNIRDILNAFLMDTDRYIALLGRDFGLGARLKKELAGYDDGRMLIFTLVKTLCDVCAAQMRTGYALDHAQGTRQRRASAADALHDLMIVPYSQIWCDAA